MCVCVWGGGFLESLGLRSSPPSLFAYAPAFLPPHLQRALLASPAQVSESSAREEGCVAYAPCYERRHGDVMRPSLALYIIAVSPAFLSSLRK